MRFSWVLLFASSVLALPAPHDACPGIMAHDGDGDCTKPMKRQIMTMPDGSTMTMRVVAPAPTPVKRQVMTMDDGSTMTMRVVVPTAAVEKRHDPNADDSGMMMDMPSAYKVATATPSPKVA